MNERIKLLAEQANILTGKDSYGKFAVIPGHEKDPLLRQGKAESYDALEKFAELLILECVNAVMDGTKEGDHYAQRIEQHFDCFWSIKILLHDAHVNLHFEYKGIAICDSVNSFMEYDFNYFLI